ncbi:MAG TPA: tetratricopeptide repeat protein [Candidatus Acidoferrales bacterium]|jgi:tetratricopeptide (TPR) repeat protein
MRRFVFFAVPLLFLFVPPLGAQQAEPVTTQPASTQSASASSDIVYVAPPKPELTSRQAAELKADVFMARKEFGDATAAYEAILESEPKNAQLLNKTAIAYQELGSLNRSERYYHRAMKADKNFASPINNLGTVEYEKKHYSKAIVLYKKALVLKMETSTIYSNLGYAYFANKEYPEAMATFDKALAIDPELFERKSGYGTIIQQRTTTDPGLFNFFVAKSYAAMGDAERAAHFLRLARDDGYKNFLSAETDPAFAKVIKDSRVQEVLHVMPSYQSDAKRAESPQQN